MQGKDYLQRRWLRRLERGWTEVERGLHLLGAGPLNPFHHLGSLAVLLLGVVVVTGLYMLVQYRPGMDRSHQTLLSIISIPPGQVVRSAHRYASEALAVVVFLHALKMFLSDRFWGPRWLSWVSGLALVALMWLIGVLGFWLAWDLRAQWLTELAVRVFGPSLAVTFLGPQAPARTFALFVIALFLHAFLGLLIVLGLFIHLARVRWPRLWAPRPLAVVGVLAVLAVSLTLPVRLLPQADFSRLVGRLPVDLLYLGVLALAHKAGGWPLAIVGAGIALAVGLPWLLKGKHPGPARVNEAECAGCPLCATDCPYNAIEMLPLGPGGKMVARVNPGRCTGCGICLGTCFQMEISLPGLDHKAIISAVRAEVEARAGESPVVAYACQAHTALGSFPTRTPMLPSRATPVLVGNPEERPMVPVTLPCAGMLNPLWLKEQMDAGASGVVVLACPEADCRFRYGTSLLRGRLERWKGILRGRVVMLEAIPGARHLLERTLALLDRGPQRESGKGRRLLRPALVAFVALALLTAVAIPLERPITVDPPGSSMVRLVMAHPGKFKKTTTEIPPALQGKKLPQGVTLEQLRGAERFPVALRVEVDGEVVMEREYRPEGVRREGLIYATPSFYLAPGEHRLHIEMRDDDHGWRTVFSGQVRLEEGRALTLHYDEESDRFRKQGVARGLPQGGAGPTTPSK